MKNKWPSRGISALVLALGVLVLLGCTSTGRSYTKTRMHETLEIDILPNTSKMFVYRLRWPQDAIPNHIRIERGYTMNQVRDPGGIELNRNSYKRLQENAAYIVEKMGYCREGYIELDRSLSRYHIWLKGECKESASADDRARFDGTEVLEIKPDI